MRRQLPYTTFKTLCDALIKIEQIGRKKLSEIQLAVKRSVRFEAIFFRCFERFLTERLPAFALLAVDFLGGEDLVFLGDIKVGKRQLRVQNYTYF